MLVPKEPLVKWKEHIQMQGKHPIEALFLENPFWGRIAQILEVYQNLSYKVCCA